MTEKRPGSPEWRARVKWALDIATQIQRHYDGEMLKGPSCADQDQAFDILARAIRAQEGEAPRKYECLACGRVWPATDMPEMDFDWHNSNFDTMETVRCEGEVVPLSRNLFAGMEDEDADSV